MARAIVTGSHVRLKSSFKTSLHNFRNRTVQIQTIGIMISIGEARKIFILPAFYSSVVIVGLRNLRKHPPARALGPAHSFTLCERACFSLKHHLVFKRIKLIFLTFFILLNYIIKSYRLVRNVTLRSFYFYTFSPI